MHHELLPVGRTVPTAMDVARNRDIADVAPFATFPEHMGRVFDALLRSPAAGWPAAGPSPSVDLSEDAEAVYVTAELPGLSGEDIAVEFEDGVLRISGEKLRSAENGRTYAVSERIYGRFERQIPIARKIDAEKVAASFKDGVLTVTLPKLEAGGGRRIEIAGAA